MVPVPQSCTSHWTQDLICARETHTHTQIAGPGENRAVKHNQASSQQQKCKKQVLTGWLKRVYFCFYINQCQKKTTHSLTHTEKDNSAFNAEKLLVGLYRREIFFWYLETISVICEWLASTGKPQDSVIHYTNLFFGFPQNEDWEYLAESNIIQQIYLYLRKLPASHCHVALPPVFPPKCLFQ